MVEKILSNFGSNLIKNYDEIIKEFGSLSYKDKDNQTLLHIFVYNIYDEDKCFDAIKILLTYGLNPNSEDAFGYNFIQTALYTGYSEKFILKIINAAIEYDLDVNHVDIDGDTMVHTAIYSENYHGEIDKIYDLLCQNEFNSAIKDNSGKFLVDAINESKKINDEQKEKFKKLMIVNIKKQKEKILAGKELSKFEKFGKILNNKEYLEHPTIGREEELKNLIVTLAQDRKSPIIVGESGVGKTALVDELAYRIKTKQVPKFLKDKIILEINPTELVAGCKYVGQFEEKISELMSLCDNDKVILFIDEIHTTFGIGTTENNHNDMAGMLRHYLDRGNFEIIGTTTREEYNKYFSTSSFKRRFEKIILNEPNKEILYQIIDKVIKDYCDKKNLRFENENLKNDIINIIIETTSKKGRVYDDPINNPDLSISIIDKAFAYALVYDGEYIKKEHFIESFKSNDRIYKSRCEEAIKKLEELKEQSNLKQNKEKQKIIKLDFGRYKK